MPANYLDQFNLNNTNDAEEFEDGSYFSGSDEDYETVDSEDESDDDMPEPVRLDNNEESDDDLPELVDDEESDDDLPTSAPRLRRSDIRNVSYESDDEPSRIRVHNIQYNNNIFPVFIPENCEDVPGYLANARSNIITFMSR